MYILHRNASYVDALYVDSTYIHNIHIFMHVYSTAYDIRMQLIAIGSFYMKLQNLEHMSKISAKLPFSSYPTWGIW